MRNIRYTQGKARFVALTVVAAGVLAACGGSAEEPAGEATSEESASSANAVTMKLIQFTPKTLEVKSGAEVTWTQTDFGVHTVTSGTIAETGSGVTMQPDDKFSSGEIATDKTYSFTFDEPGTYPYYCEIHPATMRGEVRVTG